MPSIDVVKLVEAFGDWHLWLLLLVVAAFGALGGLAHKLTAAASDTTTLAAYSVVGGVASLAALLVLDPHDAVRLVALSIAAGYGGKAILDAVEGKVRTAIAEAKTLQAGEAGQKAVDAAKKAGEHAEKLNQAVDALAAVMGGVSGKAFADSLEGLPTDAPAEVNAFLADRKRRGEELTRILFEIQRAEGAVAAAVKRGAQEGP